MSIQLGDAATWVGAVVALAAAIFTLQQLRDSRAATRSNDDRQRKQTAVDLAQEWCRTEAPSPITILRECLVECDPKTLSELLKGEPISLPIKYQGEIRTFFENVLGEHVEEKNLQPSDTGAIMISESYAHLIRNFFARRINFLEVVAAAFNSDLADNNLVEQFFGRILETNKSYKVAVEANPRGWPELASFYGRRKNGVATRISRLKYAKRLRSSFINCIGWTKRLRGSTERS